MHAGPLHGNAYAVAAMLSLRTRLVPSWAQGDRVHGVSQGTEQCERCPKLRGLSTDGLRGHRSHDQDNSSAAAIGTRAASQAVVIIRRSTEPVPDGNDRG